MDARNTKVHIAMYGKIPLNRAFCRTCRRFAFVLEGRIQCCNAQVEAGEASSVRRMSDVPSGRKIPRREDAKMILEEQEGRCLYCSRKFGSYVKRRNRVIRLKLNWDHVIPYVYSLDNRARNFVAACHICNSIKRDKIFQTVDEVKIYVQEKIKAKGYEDLFEMQECV
jgi:5-methylcytosine-specific restriction endonuclease McrA